MTDRSEALRVPIPEGAVSTIRGRWQTPVLLWATRVIIVLGLLSVALPEPAATDVAIVVIAGVVAAPLLRVLWLVHRWRQERDWRFVGLGLALLAVIALGAALAALGVGG